MRGLIARLHRPSTPLKQHLYHLIGYLPKLIFLGAVERIRDSHKDRRRQEYAERGQKRSFNPTENKTYKCSGGKHGSGRYLPYGNSIK